MRLAEGEGKGWRVIHNQVQGGESPSVPLWRACGWEVAFMVWFMVWILLWACWKRIYPVFSVRTFRTLGKRSSTELSSAVETLASNEGSDTARVTAFPRKSAGTLRVTGPSAVLLSGSEKIRIILGLFLNIYGKYSRVLSLTQALYQVLRLVPAEILRPNS